MRWGSAHGEDVITSPHKEAKGEMERSQGRAER